MGHLYRRVRSHRRHESTRQQSRVGGVYWAMGIIQRLQLLSVNCPPHYHPMSFCFYRVCVIAHHIVTCYIIGLAVAYRLRSGQQPPQRLDVAVADSLSYSIVLKPYTCIICVGLHRHITSSKIGCHLYNMCSNLLAYADDIVLLAPSWHGLQKLRYRSQSHK